MINPDDFSIAVLGSDAYSFRNIFEQVWQNHTLEFPKKYQHAAQLEIGSRFRPFLVAWGYLLSGSDFDVSSRERVAYMAVYIELLHKATIIIDDLIDEDIARHGKPAFHIEFSDHEAILFSIYLLGDSLDRLSHAIKNLKLQGQYSNLISLLATTIKDMALGGLHEVNLETDDLGSIEKIKRIIELQTIALVKNGLMVGYILGEGSTDGIHVVESLGHDAGYLFQALNDMEPFYGADRNAAYKGNENPDFGRFRKNYVVATLLDKLSADRRDDFILHGTNVSHKARATWDIWLQEHGVLGSISVNLDLVKQNIDQTVELMATDINRKIGFLSFVNHVLDRALSRLDDAPRQKLSEILIT